TDISMESIRAEQTNFVLSMSALIAVLTILICIVGIMIVDHIIIKPINMLSTAASGYSHHNQNGLDRININTKDEIESLYISLKQMTCDINMYIGDLMSTTNELALARTKADRMDRLAHKDALTGVWSKLAYERKVDELTDDLRSGQGTFGIAVVDMNNLKKLNDTYGHEKGDIAIKKMCSIICDVFGHSQVYRYGGDEFVVILKNRDIENADALVKEFNIRSEATTGRPWEKVSAAIGYAVYDGDDTVNDVFRRADSNMYERKKEMKHQLKKKKKAVEKKDRVSPGDHLCQGAGGEVFLRREDSDGGGDGP
ncbi:MAG: GGDEF domain-containing protein, partial [Lachnospiraceae bacterium]|nr:GGDEF domain-containing protein [Lachnospiraceae bacterium]